MVLVTSGPTLALSSSRSSPSLGVGSVPHSSLSAGLGAAHMAAPGASLPPVGDPLASQGSLRRRTKQEVAEALLANLRARGSVDVDSDGFADAIKQHFESLPSRQAANDPPDRVSCSPLPACPQLLPPPPSRYALDVNINSLDVLNHKRLLDSARADPTAVSFQLRPVDVVSGSDLAKRPSFGSLDTLQMQAYEVRLAWGGRGGRCPGGRQAGGTLSGRVLLVSSTTLLVCGSRVGLTGPLSSALLLAVSRPQLLATQVWGAAAAATRLWIVAQPAGGCRLVGGVSAGCSCCCALLYRWLLAGLELAGH